MSKAGPSTNAHGSLLELKAITAEHADRFAKEGKQAVHGGPRTRVLDVKSKSKDQFDRPSPGLVKRLAREAKADAKKRHFADDGSGVSEEQRRAIMEAKAKKYEALKRGDVSGFSERELAEANIDIGGDEWSDHSSDVDESAVEAREVDTLDDLEIVEYEDEMGRTRTGTRREAREAERERQKSRPRQQSTEVQRDSSSYAEVQKSTFIHGEQNFFPVYQPDPEALKKKYMEAEKEARAHHYDSTKEVRVRGAGAYQFSLDEEERAKQMAQLEAERNATDQARTETAKRGGMSAAQEAKKRRLEERKALVEAKRARLLGGTENVARLRAEQKAKEADKFLEGLDQELNK